MLSHLVERFVVQVRFVVAESCWIVLTLNHLRALQPISLLISLYHQIWLRRRIQLIIIRVFPTILQIVVVAWIVAGDV